MISVIEGTAKRGALTMTFNFNPELQALIIDFMEIVLVQRRAQKGVAMH
jgi:hypothetical protein